ncbi:MAG: hypothetical protein ACI37Q_00150 [Candidatus Gastranaerophilaceae bacterium]
MGKSKTRIFRKGINDQITKITRESAIVKASKSLNSGITTEAKSLITMFGLTAEELLEAGTNYEAIVSIKNIFEG